MLLTADLVANLTFSNATALRRFNSRILKWRCCLCRNNFGRMFLSCLWNGSDVDSRTFYNSGLTFLLVLNIKAKSNFYYFPLRALTSIKISLFPAYFVDCFWTVIVLLCDLQKMLLIPIDSKYNEHRHKVRKSITNKERLPNRESKISELIKDSETKWSFTFLMHPTSHPRLMTVWWIVGIPLQLRPATINLFNKITNFRMTKQLLVSLLPPARSSPSSWERWSVCRMINCFELIFYSRFFPSFNVHVMALNSWCQSKVYQSCRCVF